jgi:hypothetical protein
MTAYHQPQLRSQAGAPKQHPDHHEEKPPLSLLKQTIHCYVLDRRETPSGRIAGSTDFRLTGLVGDGELSRNYRLVFLRLFTQPWNNIDAEYRSCLKKLGDVDQHNQVTGEKTVSHGDSYGGRENLHSKSVGTNNGLKRLGRKRLGRKTDSEKIRLKLHFTATSKV